MNLIFLFKKVENTQNELENLNKEIGRIENKLGYRLEKKCTKTIRDGGVGIIGGRYSQIKSDANRDTKTRCHVVLYQNIEASTSILDILEVFAAIDGGGFDVALYEGKENCYRTYNAKKKV